MTMNKNEKYFRMAIEKPQNIPLQIMQKLNFGSNKVLSMICVLFKLDTCKYAYKLQYYFIPRKFRSVLQKMCLKLFPGYFYEIWYNEFKYSNYSRLLG